MGKLNILNRDGHTQVVWDVEKEETVAEAERIFNETRGSGALMTEVKEGVGQEQINQFNPEAEEIVAHRPLTGG